MHSPVHLPCHTPIPTHPKNTSRRTQAARRKSFVNSLGLLRRKFGSAALRSHWCGHLCLWGRAHSSEVQLIRPLRAEIKGAKTWRHSRETSLKASDQSPAWAASAWDKSQLPKASPESQASNYNWPCAPCGQHSVSHATQDKRDTSVSTNISFHRTEEIAPVLLPREMISGD